MINARSDELTYLMDSLLDVSRIQSGRLALEPTQFDLHTLVSKVFQYFQFDLQRRRRVIRLDLPAEQIDVQWDLARIERVLINLIGNAIKYSPEGGEVSVRVRLINGAASCGSEHVELSVTDRGIGIPPEDRERIFERFYRVPSTAAKGYKGTGLGLSICRRIIEAHGGRIWVEDALHGGPGSTFYVVMPREIGQPEADRLEAV